MAAPPRPPAIAGQAGANSYGYARDWISHPPIPSEVTTLHSPTELGSKADASAEWKEVP